MKRKLVYGLGIPLLLVGFYSINLLLSNANQSGKNDENYMPLKATELNTKQNFVVETNDEIDEVIANSPSPTPSEQTQETEEPTEEELKELVQAFAEVHFNYDSSLDPWLYIDQSQPYITDDFYNQLNENPRRPVLGVNKVSVRDFDIQPVQQEGQDTLPEVWDIGLILKRDYDNGESTKETFHYWVTLDPRQDWLISEVTLQ